MRSQTILYYAIRKEYYFTNAHDNWIPNMIEVKFYRDVEDCLLKFAVVDAKYNGKWVLRKHKERNTYEIAGGHREENENIIDTAIRELFEETGACEFDIKPVCVYSVIGKTELIIVEKKCMECYIMRKLKH